MTTVLVTGATGNVGSRLIRRLRDGGTPVRAFVRDAHAASLQLGDDVALTVGTLGDPSAVRRAMDGVDTVFLACGNDPRQLEYEGNVIDAAAAAGVRRLVKLSAIGAAVDSRLRFWNWHGRIERHLRASLVPAVVLRPSFYMSNLLASAEQVRGQGRLFAPAGGARIAMVDPADVAAVAAVALTARDVDGLTWELTGPAAITHAEVAETLSDVLAVDVGFVDVPDEVARQGLVATGMPEWLAEQLVVLYALLREGAAEAVTDTVRAVTGAEPQSFAEFARRHAAHFRGYAGYAPAGMERGVREREPR